MAHRVLCHVTTQPAWDAADGSLSAEPFLHCCTEAQLPFVLARHFAGQDRLLILRFDPQHVQGYIRWERSEPGQDPFPHLYGSLPLAAVAVSRS